MIYANGKIKKHTVCPNCYAKITWDASEDEYTNSIGDRYVRCPQCGAPVVLTPITEEVEETGASDTVDIVIDGQAASAEDITKALEDGKKVSLVKDLEASDYIAFEQGGELDLNGKTLTLPEECDVEISGENPVTISNGTIDYAATSDYNAALDVYDGGHLILNNVTLKSSKQGIGVEEGAIVELTNSTVIANNDAAVCLNGKGAKVTINGGEYVTTNQAPIFLNGSTKYGDCELTINGATLTCTDAEDEFNVGIAAMNNDTITVKNSIINANTGSGIVVRGGKVTVDAATKFNVGGTGTGLVGSSSVQLPMGKEIIIDRKSNYPAVDTINVSAPGHDITELNADETPSAAATTASIKSVKALNVTATVEVNGEPTTTHHKA